MISKRYDIPKPCLYVYILHLQISREVYISRKNSRNGSRTEHFTSKKDMRRQLITLLPRHTTHAPSSPVASSKPGAASPSLSPSTRSFPSGPSEHVGRKHVDFSRTVRPLRPLRSEESHSGTTEPRPPNPQSSPRLNLCSGCTRGSPERQRSSPSEPETKNEERPWPLGSRGSLILLGAAWVWLLLRDHLKGNEIGLSLEATSTLLDYGRLSEAMEWRQRWFATQRHKITLYCLRGNLPGIPSFK
ncbi:hypothetical protein F2Q70_00043678 [Brassica cretica]|uniref:Uncharacterized protein n=1 Tax=Brassica cretica TaxID=69181 RepID=A0A8S9KM76_BRACR|nr:hypothetical protein F2Q70_00043678 [Brassica cretica]